MSREFPDWINPWAAAQGHRIFSGTIPLARMKRLVGLLERPDGVAEFSLSLDLDTDQRPVMELKVSAWLWLMCQASLEEYRQQVERESLLGVIESEAEIELMPSHYDPVVVENGRLAIADLVEDELLIGLPQVPRNPDLDRVEYQSGEELPASEEVEQPPNPFAVLGELKNKEPGKS